jgi:hypothetical protein
MTTSTQNTQNTQNFQDLSYVSSHIDPKEFEYVGSVFLVSYDNELGEKDGEPIMNFEDGKAEELFEANSDLFWSQEFKCNCCNHKIKHSQWFKHTSGSYHAVGNDCGASIMKYRVDIKGAQKQSLAIKRRQDRMNKLFAIEQEYPNLLADMEMYHPIIEKIRNSMLAYAKISEKQVALVAKLAEEKRAKEAVSKPVPTGKKVFIDEMKVVKSAFKYVPPFGYEKYGSGKIVVTLEHKDGYKIWTTIASGLSERFENHIKAVEWYNGKTVKNLLFGSIDTGKDAYFGFGKRLSKAKKTNLHFLDEDGNVAEGINLWDE